MLRAILPFFVVALSACSIYKSQVRKDFESKAPDLVQTNSFLGACETLGVIPAWFEREFPGRPTELLVADADLEVRLMTTAEGTLVVRSDRMLDDGHVESCKREFAGEAQWLESRAAYLEALGVPVLD